MLLKNENLSNFSPENQIMLCAASASDFQEIILLATNFLEGSIMVADSLHYILARTNDLDIYDKEASWIDMINAGILPPMRPGMPHPPPLKPIWLQSALLGSNISVHFSIPTLNGSYCTMFDLLDANNIALKLTITMDHPLSFIEKQRAITLATAIHNAYYRLGIGSRNDAKEHYLRDLLFHNSAPGKALSPPNEFNPTGTFVLVGFLISGLGVHNLEFVAEFCHLVKMPNVLVTRIGDMLNILYNQESETEDFLETLNLISKKYNVSILVSDPFTDLADIRKAYDYLQDATKLFSHFKNAAGIQTPNSCHMFLMFEYLHLTNNGKTSLLPDAQVVINHDVKKNTQYTLTMYCYLLNNCEAPKTAEQLFIHRNTLDKRLRKIETLIDAKWHSQSFQFRMLYTLFCYFYTQNSIPFFPLD